MAMTETDVLERAEQTALAGIWAPAVTAYDETLAPDAGLLVEQVRRLLTTGCHGVGLFGTTGEGTSLTVDERIALVEAVLEAGVAPERLMVGTGCAALSDTVRLTAAVVALGCSRSLMLPPFYYKDVSDEGLYASFAEVIERVGDARLDIVLYHFPRLSCVPITHPVVERLRRAYPDSIVGIKDSSGDLDSTAGFVEAFPDLAVFAGTEALLLDALTRGGAGSITASANVNARAIRAVYDAWAAGRDAAALQAQITAHRKALQSRPMIPMLKHILAEELGQPAWRRVRPPLVSLSAESGESARADLGAAGFAFTAE